MKPHQLLLLSTYRLPSDRVLSLGHQEAPPFLNGYLALWHPAALACAAALPQVASPHDHETPAAEHLYVVPDCPPNTVADNFPEEARAAAALVVPATTDRAETITGLLETL